MNNTTSIILLSVLLYFCNIAFTFSANKDCSNFKLQVLGEGGPEINDGLASSSYLIWINNKARVLIDAGGGSSLNFEKSKANFNDLEAILLTHLHVDHSAALPVYVKAGYFVDRKKSLPLFGPTAAGSFPSTEAFAAALFNDKQLSVYPYLSDNLYKQPSTDFLIIPKSISAKTKVWSHNITDTIVIKAIAVNHGPIPALAWRIESNLCSVTFSGDMNGSSGHLEILAKNTDILVANNAIPQNAFSVAKRLHMTPKKIGEIAQQAQVGKLVISHFMLRTINRKGSTKRLIRKSYQGEIFEAQALSFYDL